MWHRNISGLVALFNGRQNKSRRNGRQHGLRRGGRWRYRCLISIISSPKLSIVDKRQVSDLLLCELLRYIGKRVRKTSNSSFFLTDGPVFVMYFGPRVGGFPLFICIHVTWNISQNRDFPVNSDVNISLTSFQKKGINKTSHNCGIFFK